MKKLIILLLCALVSTAFGAAGEATAPGDKVKILRHNQGDASHLGVCSVISLLEKNLECVAPASDDEFYPALVNSHDLSQSLAFYLQLPCREIQ